MVSSDDTETDTASTEGQRGHQVDTAAAEEGSADAAGTASAEEIVDAVHPIRFACLDGAVYHASREAFLARCYRLFTGIQVLAATAAVGTFVTNNFQDAAPWLTLFVALVGVVNLVMDPAGGARDHRIQRQRFYELLAVIEESKPSETLLRKWNGALHRLYANGGPEYRAVKALSFNVVVDMLYPEDQAKRERLTVPFLDRWFANIYTFRGKSYAP